MQLAKVELGGEQYVSLLTRIHDRLRPRTYVEIGVASGKTLRLAPASTFAIGIDPEPKISVGLSANARVFTETSDAFFAERDVSAELGGHPVDLAFIDGMHLFEFALRDFINLERHASPGGVILIHDCYPLEALTAGRDRSSVYWTGDVWRTVLALRQYRPDLRVHTLASPPSGLALVTHLDPHSRVLAERYDEIVRELMACDYDTIAPRKAQLLNVVPAQWPQIDELLSHRH
jgi:Methyltransferase domain